MKIKDFKLERYFAIHEFSAKYLMSSSDCDGFKMKDVLRMADDGEMELWDSLELGYTESTGHPHLKDAILKHYNSFDRDNVLVSSPGELAFALMNTILSDKDHAIVVSPSYQSLYEVIRSIGCDISFWNAEEKDWSFSMESLKKLVQSNTKLLIINFPHNPTGSYLKRGELDDIISFAREHNLYLYSDEMYYKLNYRDDYPSLPPVAVLYEKGISLWGMSKSFGMAGVRIGWLVSQDVDLLRRVASFKDYLSICAGAPSEILSIIALNHSEYFLNKNIEKIKRNIALFQDFIASQTPSNTVFTDFIPPKAGSVSFVKIRNGISSMEFSDKLVRRCGIMTVPSEIFDYRSGFIRVGFGRENLSEILTLLSVNIKVTI